MEQLLITGVARLVRVDQENKKTFDVEFTFLDAPLHMTVQLKGSPVPLVVNRLYHIACRGIALAAYAEDRNGDLTCETIEIHDLDVKSWDMERNGTDE